jgi:LuxR family transcriptional regulator, maltose regulon positive regulatory protein
MDVSRSKCCNLHVRRLGKLPLIAAANPAVPVVEGLPSETRLPAPQPAPGEAERVIALSALGRGLLSAGDLEAAETTLVESFERAVHAQMPCLASLCTSRLALVRAACGKLHDAERLANEALRLAPCDSGAQRARCANSHLALALVAAERDRLDDCERYLSVAQRACDGGSQPEIAAAISSLRAEVRDGHGDLLGSRWALATVYRMLGEAQRAPATTRRLAAVEPEVRASGGVPSRARELVHPPRETGHAPFAVALARTYLHDDDPLSALRVLPPWADDASPGQPLRLRLSAGLLEAFAARKLGDRERASRALERVLQLAEPEGFRRVFIRPDVPVRDLLVTHLDSGTAYWSLINDLIGGSDTGPRSSGPVSAVLVDPLTNRELVVLRYLQSGLSKAEIAAELYVSINTVKTHVRNVFRKLGASRRRDAVLRARELRML